MRVLVQFIPLWSEWLLQKREKKTVKRVKKKFFIFKMFVLSRVCIDLSSHLYLLKVLSSVSWPKCHLDTKNSWPGRLWTPCSPCCFPDFTIILIFLFFSRSRRTSWVCLCWLWSSWSRRRCCRKSLRLLIKPESDAPLHDVITRYSDIITVRRQNWVKRQVTFWCE